MHPRVVTPVLMLLALSWSGCIGDDGTATPELPEPSPPGPQTQIVNDDGIILRLLPDPWAPNETERILFDGTVEAVDCFPDRAMHSFSAITGTPFQGCAEVPLPDGAIVPPGSAMLRVEADASEALEHGSWSLAFATMGRNSLQKARAEATSEPRYTWELPLTPRDWDLADATVSHTRVTLWAEGFYERADPGYFYRMGSVLKGPVVVKVTVTRDLAWVPEPLVDHWNRTTGLHEFVSDDALVLVNETGDWRSDQEALLLADNIPRGTDRVVLGFAWEPITDCGAPPTLACTVLGSLTSDEVRSHWSNSAYQRELGERYSIIVWTSPYPVVWDEDDAAESLTGATRELYYRCLGGSCGAPPTTTVKLTTRIEAWRGEVDLDAFKGRLGVS